MKGGIHEDFREYFIPLDCDRGLCAVSFPILMTYRRVILSARMS